MPHNPDGRGVALDEAVVLVERARASADRHAIIAFEAVAIAALGWVIGVALRECPLGHPPSIAGSQSLELGRFIGPPWGKDQKLAMAAATVAIATSEG